MNTKNKLPASKALELFAPLIDGGLPKVYEYLRELYGADGASGDGAAARPERAAHDGAGARIDPSAWYSISDVAQLLPWTPRTLEAWRGAGKGPAWSRVGGRILYRGEDLLRFLEAGRQLDADQRRARRAQR